MPIKFPKNYSTEIDRIEGLLKDNIFPEESLLRNLYASLNKIYSQINKDLAINALPYLEEQKNRVTSLMWKCENLFTRIEIISIAEAAEKLLHTSQKLSKKELNEQSKNLSQKIKNIVNNKTLSYINSKFVRFAHALVDKAIKQEPIKHSNIINLDKIRYSKQDSFIKAEEIYNAAHLLYNNNYEDFESAIKEQFTNNTIEEMNRHIKICSGSYKNFDDKVSVKKAIQGMLGYAHLLVDYHTNISPYPDLKEIDSILMKENNLL